jgi:methionyl-tRNA formyltransferase
VLTYLTEQGVQVCAVVTRPDRPKGRSLQLTSPPVKQVAEKLESHPPIHQPEKASTPEFAAVLSAYEADLFVVVAYGEIIKQFLLDLPKWGCINVHASLLPKYRGAAPIQRALMQGESVSGVTIMEMVLQMDAGALFEVVEVPIPEEMTFGELEDKLCLAAGPALLKVLRAFESGKVEKVPQDSRFVTFAAKLTPEEEQIQWERPARELHNLIRALSPAPGAWCFLEMAGEKKRLKIKRSSIVPDQSGNPGQILAFGKEGWVVSCGQGALRLLEVQLEGKKSMTTEDFIKGVRPEISIKFT